MRPENIPRRQERMILADVKRRFDRLLVNRMFATNDVAALPNARTSRELYGGPPCVVRLSQLNKSHTRSVSQAQQHCASCNIW